MNGYWHVKSRKWSESYSFDSKCYFFLPDTLKVTGFTISTPKSYDEHPRQVKYGSPPPPGVFHWRLLLYLKTPTLSSFYNIILISCVLHVSLLTLRLLYFCLTYFYIVSLVITNHVIITLFIFVYTTVICKVDVSSVGLSPEPKESDE